MSLVTKGIGLAKKAKHRFQDQLRERTLPALRQALAQGRCRAVLSRNTPHFRKGLSQWTKARRSHKLPRLAKAAAYLAYCAALDAVRPLRTRR